MFLMVSVIVALLFYAALAFFISPIVAAVWMIVGFFFTTRANKDGVLKLEGEVLLSIIVPLVLVKVIAARIRAFLRLRRTRKTHSGDPS